VDAAEAARAAVVKATGRRDWKIGPLGGSTGRTWLATGGETVVVRLDASPEVLVRVAQRGIGPAVLASGQVAGRTFVVQEHVDAPSPSARWLSEHVVDVGSLFGSLAGDPVLARLAPPLEAPSFAVELLDSARNAGLGHDRIGLVERLAGGPPPISADELRATHGDPNRTNLLAGDRLLLVDWDDLRRADPLRDLGPLAWWYLPEVAWPDFLAAAGQPWTEAVLDRFWWWTAAESLDVALRLLAHDRAGAEGFLGDFVCAARRQPNPRRDL
jgi:hypothetical protein